MPNGEETKRNTSTEEPKSLRSTEDELTKLRQQLAAVESAREEATRQVNDEKARVESERARAESEKARAETEKARAETEKARAESEKARAERAEKESQEARECLHDDSARKEFLDAVQQTRRGLREFVQKSLSDNLAGVDNAAVDARHRQLDGGLKDSGFITPGRIGSPTDRGRESAVEFDLAVVARQETETQTTNGEETSAEARASFIHVIPLGLSAEASLRVRSERHRAELSDLRHHNRVRFTVPVTFASLEDPVE